MVWRWRTPPLPGLAGDGRQGIAVRGSLPVWSCFRASIHVVELDLVGAGTGGRRRSWIAVHLALRQYLAKHVAVLLIYVLQHENAGQPLHLDRRLTCARSRAIAYRHSE